MSCTERQKLVGLYQAAVRAYHEAADSLETDVFTEAWQRAELERKKANSARAELLHHERVHACSSGSRTNSSVFGTLSLFSVDRERWEPFEVAACGQPPAGALAYKILLGREGGQWVIDPQELNGRQPQVAELHLTEAGLKALRESGLEM